VNDETIRVAIAAAVILNVLVVAIGIVASLLRRARQRAVRMPGLRRLAPTFGESMAAEGMALLDWLSDAGPTQHEPTYDRVFRIASWTFLLVTAGIVGLSGMWGARLPQIVTLVAVAGVFVLVIHDVLPGGALRPIKAIVQAVVAVTFAALLVFLTGGYQSPFFFTFPLVVGGAALVVAPAAAFVLALVAAAGYLAAAGLSSGDPTSFQIVATAVNLTGMFVLTYIASAVGREQHRARDAALRMSALD
jgi:hypothetical protein